MSQFINSEIHLSEIPLYQKVNLNKIEASYKKVVILNYLSIFIMFMVVIGVVYFVNDFSLLLLFYTVIIFMIIIVLLMFLNIKSIEYRGFAFRQHDIINATGFVLKNMSIVPTNRIQHITIHQGIFSRLFNLCSLKIYTASTGNSDITINGISYTDALGYKQFILNKINTVQNA